MLNVLIRKKYSKLDFVTGNEELLWDYRYCFRKVAQDFCDTVNTDENSDYYPVEPGACRECCL